MPENIGERAFLDVFKLFKCPVLVVCRNCEYPDVQESHNFEK